MVGVEVVGAGGTPFADTQAKPAVLKLLPDVAAVMAFPVAARDLDGDVENHRCNIRWQLDELLVRDVVGKAFGAAWLRVFILAFDFEFFGDFLIE